MRSTETRVSELEKRAGTDAKPITVWVVAFVRPGPDGPITSEPKSYAEMGKDGLRWNRQPGETLKELKERVTREVPRSAHGSAVLIECYGDEEEEKCS